MCAANIVDILNKEETKTLSTTENGELQKCVSSTQTTTMQRKYGRWELGFACFLQYIISLLSKCIIDCSMFSPIGHTAQFCKEGC